MSREINFRAYDLVRKEFLSAGQVLIAINSGQYPLNDIYLDILTSKNTYRDRFVLQQYTGIKDMRKIPIYEGDILYCSEYDSEDHKIIQTFENAVVGFDKGCFHYYIGKNFNCPHQVLIYAYNPIVIGNIYSTPQLLK